MISSCSAEASIFGYSEGFILQSPDITKLVQAMLIVQQQLQPAIKDAKNPFICNEYAPSTLPWDPAAAFFPLKVTHHTPALIMLN